MDISRIKTVLFTFLFAVSINLICAQSQISIKQFKLDNGLTVILNEDHSKPEVFGVVIVKAGQKNDPADATGMAHYQEHMLFKGTDELGTIDWEKEKPHIDKIFELYDQLGKTKDEKERKKIQQQINDESLKANEYTIPNELSNLIKSTGGTKLNANTGSDRTVYFNAFPSNQIEKWLEIYSHRFINPVFRGFQSELEVVYEEKNLYSDMFQFSLIEEFNKKFFKKHPYGQQSIIGTIEHLKNPSLTNMYLFFKTYYVANNMALVLSGDFNTDEIIPFIKEKFGKLKSGEIPKMKEFKEEPFNGRELVEMRLTPIKMALLGFRTAPEGHPDEIALDVCNGILSNQNQTGLLDKLSIDNKVLITAILPMNHNDYGSTILLIIPKILGQKLEQAEQLVMNELEKLGKGEFDEAMIESVKNQLYKDFQLSMESIDKKAVMLAEAFGQNRDINDYLNYTEKLKKITRDDIVRIAKIYYGKNYLAFFSKMGFPKKQKIDKPEYKPVLSNTEAKSGFAKKLEQIPSKDPIVKFIDFKNDIISGKLQDGVNFYYVKNPFNNIFTLDLKFGIGTYKIPVMEYASEIMNYAGTKKQAVSDFKKEFAKIGCSYSIACDNSYFTITLEGIEENLKAGVKLLGELFNEPVLEKNKLDNIIQGERTNRKMERSEPDNVASALLQYVRYGNYSSTLHRLSIKEIMALNTDSLVASFKNALQYECEIHYVGKTDPEQVKEILKSEITFSKTPMKSTSPVVLEDTKYGENTVFFVNMKSAVQSKIYLFSNGTEFNVKDQPVMDAFNLYFGGDFSGLVLQEIREYRSLAYGAGASYSSPLLSGKNTSFTGYVGTQADKSLEAIQVFTGLVRKMPEKKERIDMIRQYLLLSALTNRPHFRDLSETMVRWKNQGYEEDPIKLKIEKYKNLTFEDITNFYKANLQAKPVVYSIVGNKKRINLKELSKYGKIVKVKEKSLFK